MSSERKVVRRSKSARDEAYNERKTKESCDISKSSEGSTILKTILDLDEKLTSQCALCANKDSSLSSFRPLMKVIEISCHGIPWLLVTIVLLLSVHRANDVETLVNLLYGLILDLIMIGLLKVCFRRSRPQHNEMDMFATVSIDKFSFPSGHASRAGLLACFFVLHVVSSVKWRMFTLWWSTVVCLSRVILGRHHFVDIICGYVVGLIEYLILLYLWIPTETCMSWLELYFSHFHL